MHLLLAATYLVFWTCLDQNLSGDATKYAVRPKIWFGELKRKSAALRVLLQSSSWRATGKTTFFLSG